METIIKLTNFRKIENKEIRIADNLLFVLGENGAGKTAFVEAVKSNNCQIIQNNQLRKVSCKIIDNNVDLKTIIQQLFGLNHLNEQYQKFIQTNFSFKYQKLLQRRIGTLDEFLAVEDLANTGYRRLVVIGMLCKIAEKEKLLVLIDEPELLTHPLLLEEIVIQIRRLQEKDSIVIIATNSQYVVETLFTDIEQVIKLTNINEIQTIEQVNASKILQKIHDFYYSDVYLLRRFSSSKQDDEGMKRVIDEYARNYLSSVFRNQIFGLIFSKTVILGEGSSEGVFFDYLQVKLHPDWLREKQVQFMSCLGKGTMPLYFIFLNELGINTICMYDYDNDENLVHVAYQRAFRRYCQDHPTLFRSIALQPDLEEYLAIGSDHKLVPIEKPVNVFENSFVHDTIKTKAYALLDTLKQLVIEIEDA